MNQGTQKASSPYPIAVVIGYLLALFMPLSLLASSANVQELIKNLHDDSFQTRETAHKQLWKSGQSSLPALREIVNGTDPELAARAEKLILCISIGLTHDSPQEVLDLASQYQKSDDTTKLSILQDLGKRKYFEQGLRLVKLDENSGSEISEKIIQYINDIARHLAQKAIVAGNINEAQNILELTPNSMNSSILRAWMHRYQGLAHFKKTLRKAEKSNTAEAAQWRLALHCVNSDSKAALAEAEKANIPYRRSVFQLLEGDPLPWLKSNLDQRGANDTMKAACNAQIYRLTGEDHLYQSAISSITESHATNPRNNPKARYSLAALAVSGEKDLALEILTSHFPDETSSYHQLHENSLASLNLIGIEENRKFPTQEWIDSTTKQALEEEGNDEYTGRLLQLASYLNSCGEPGQAMLTISPMMKQLREEKNLNPWFEAISAMATYGLSKQAVEFIKTDSQNPQELDRGVSTLINFLDQASASALLPWQQDIWELLKKRHKDNLPAAVNGIALLSGHLPSNNGETKLLHDTLLKEISQTPEIDDTVYRTHLFEFARLRNDYVLAIDMIDEFAKENKEWQSLKNYYDRAFCNWPAAEKNLREKAVYTLANYELLTDYYICLRKLNKAPSCQQTLQSNHASYFWGITGSSNFLALHFIKLAMLLKPSISGKPPP